MLRKTRIFVVDDHSLVREWLGQLVGTQADMELCGQSADARNALVEMEKAKPDVAIVDLSLKGMSGLDLIKDLRDRFAATLVIVLSMHEEVGYVQRALRAGARGYVMKRDSSAHILDAIRKVRGGGIYANPDVLEQLTARMMALPAESPKDPVECLSDRELEVFRRMGQGQGTREIATELGLSIKTVQGYCVRAKEKLGIGSGTELAREAVRWIERE
jgi:DNA-binding NarL/FixJ family response regulator